MRRVRHICDRQPVRHHSESWHRRHGNVAWCFHNFLWHVRMHRRYLLYHRVSSKPYDAGTCIRWNKCRRNLPSWIRTFRLQIPFPSCRCMPWQASVLPDVWRSPLCWEVTFRLRQMSISFHCNRPSWLLWLHSYCLQYKHTPSLYKSGRLCGLWQVGRLFRPVYNSNHCGGSL